MHSLDQDQEEYGIEIHKHKDFRMTIFEYDKKRPDAIDYMNLGKEKSIGIKIKNIQNNILWFKRLLSTEQRRRELRRLRRKER